MLNKKKYAGILITSSENLCNITKKIVKDKFLLLKFYKKTKVYYLFYIYLLLFFIFLFFFLFCYYYKILGKSVFLIAP